VASPLTPQKWAQIREIFEAAVDLRPEARSAFLAERCASDHDLRVEVESLLAQHDATECALDRPAWNPATGPAHPAEPPWMPSRIGAYRILSLLGEGGMGSVYEAEQEQPRRVVALKVIQAGRTAADLLRRFELESEALARLQHPGIAQIYDAGTADAGFGLQPYFAMEFVRGQALNTFAAAHHPSIRQRLELMAKVCDAVEHAHRRGIIHRDLKPANILVDQQGEPKVVDFGVARVTDSDAEATRHTDLGLLVGTLAYMSPEQVLGDPRVLDTRSDVYSLGVILYQLLAERMPYALTTDLRQSMMTIREQDPVPLSSIRRGYSGDIETIVSKALEKDKAQRYGSAAALAEDLRRYLRNEPILARSPSAIYQLQKLMQRHRALVASGALALIVLAGGAIATTVEAIRARRAEKAAVEQRNLATTESAKAKAVIDFLQNDVLAQASATAQSSPDTKPDPKLTVRAALDRAAARITGKFDKQPLVEASIRDTVANAYTELGLYPQAQQQIERALELRRKTLGQDHAETLGNLNDLAQLYAYQGNYARAEPMYTRILDGWHRIGGEQRPEALTAMSSLAELYLYQGKYSQAEALYSKTLEISRRVLGNEHIDTLARMTGLAVAYKGQGKYDQAEALYSKTLDISRRVLGSEHPDTITNMGNLAAVYTVEGRYKEAEALWAQTLEISGRVLGEEHPNNLIFTNNLADLYQMEGKYSQAKPLFTRILAVRQRVLGEEHPDTIMTEVGLAGTYLNLGDVTHGRALLEKVLETQKRVLGEPDPATLATMAGLARIYQNQGKYALAESLSTKVLEARRRALGEQNPTTVDAMALLGEIRLREQKYGEAEPLLRAVLKAPEDSKRDSWTRYYAQNLLGATLAGEKKYADAEPLLIAGYLGMKQRAAAIPVLRRRDLNESGDRIVRLYEAWSKQDKAVEWRIKVRNNGTH
jgi:tetratricopeptide (TPR) repeat protein